MYIMILNHDWPEIGTNDGILDGHMDPPLFNNVAFMFGNVWYLECLLHFCEYLREYNVENSMVS